MTTEESDKISNENLKKYNYFKYIMNLGIIKRILMVLGVFGIIIYFIGCILLAFIKVICWIILNTLEIFLVIPYGIIWIFTGKFYGFKIEEFINEKTGYFKSMYKNYNQTD